jgi:Zn-dependent protease with chaperone function
MKIFQTWFAFGPWIFLVWLCFVCPGVCGSEPANTPPPPSQLPAQIEHLAPDTSPVAVPEPDAKALSHYHSGMTLVGVFILWNLLILMLFLFTGFSARTRSWAERWGRRWYATFVLYCIGFGLVYYLASLPLNFYAGFIQPHSYDLSNQTFNRWLGNYVKNAVVMIGLGLVVGWFPFFMIKQSPRRWWLYLGLLAAPFLCVMEFIQPVVIDPLFHRFQPLQDQALETKILAEAARGGIESGRVYEVNMSADTKTLNAYVTGFMGTKRIVLWDTTLKSLKEDELLFILGHEMGHYVLGHLIKLIVFNSVLIILLWYVVYRLAGRVIERFHMRFGFSSLSDFAALPLLALLILIVSLAGLPIPMAFSRHIEHEADRFGLELTHNNHAAATAFVKLQQNSLGISRPGILVKIWLFDHPSVGERIDFCNRYRPWETGQPSRYDQYIRPQPQAIPAGQTR